MADKMATRDGYGKALIELGNNRDDIVVLDADLAKSTRTNWFAKEFPERFIDIGIAEQNMMCIASGLASTGKTVFASSFAIFATGRAWEQIRNTVCLGNFNVKIAATHAGIAVGPDGASHQAVEDIAVMRCIPRMSVVVPCDGPEAMKATITAAETDGPMYIRLGRTAFESITDESTPFELGKGSLMKEGGDVTIVACGQMVAESLKAAEALEKEKISARVINMHTIKPIDHAILEAAAEETGAIVTAEEHSIYGGLGSAVAESLSVNVPVPMEMVGMYDQFGCSGDPNDLYAHFGLTSKDIVEKVHEVLKRKK